MFLFLTQALMKTNLQIGPHTQWNVCLNKKHAQEREIKIFFNQAEQTSHQESEKNSNFMAINIFSLCQSGQDKGKEFIDQMVKSQGAAMQKYFTKLEQYGFYDKNKSVLFPIKNQRFRENRLSKEEINYLKIFMRSLCNMTNPNLSKDFCLSPRTDQDFCNLQNLVRKIVGEQDPI